MKEFLVVKVKFVCILLLTGVIAYYLQSSANSLGLYALVTLPGTFLHELAHYVTAALLQGNPGNFNLIPSGNTLGSITFSPNWYNAATVGMAPLLLAPLTVFLAAISARSNNILKIIFGGYLSACSWIACTPSSQDFYIAVVPTSWPLAICMLSFLTWGIYKIVLLLIR